MRKNCNTCKHVEVWKSNYCDDCLYGNPPTKWEASDWYKPDTQAEIIRGMTDEELAKLLFDVDSRDGHSTLEEWQNWIKLSSIEE